MGGQADEDPGPGVGQGSRRGARMLHRPPGGLQQESVLGVHPLRLARRHPEERRVEPGGVVDESGAPGDDLAWSGRVRIKEFVGVPPVGGNLRHRVPAAVQQIPELVGIRGTGQPRRVADDGETRRLITHIRWLPSLPCRRGVRCPSGSMSVAFDARGVRCPKTPTITFRTVAARSHSPAARPTRNSPRSPVLHAGLPTHGGVSVQVGRVWRRLRWRHGYLGESGHGVQARVHAGAGPGQTG